MAEKQNTAAEGWAFDWNAIKYKESRQFESDLREADESKIHGWMARVIVRWPFALPPGDPASYGELGWADHREVTSKFIEAYFRFKGIRLPADDGGKAAGGGGDGEKLSGADQAG